MMDLTEINVFAGIHLCSSSILVSGSIDQRICVWRIEQATESQIEVCIKHMSDS